MSKFIEIQNKAILDYKIVINNNSKCWGRIHAHVKERMVCKWKQANGISSTFTLLHEIGHVETFTSKMRRCESEFYATQWAINECNKYGLKLNKKIIQIYQDYIFMELDRGVRRGGKGYPTKEQLTLRGYILD